MKKLYAFIVAAMATLSTQAQVVLTQNGKVCSPSETVVIKAVEVWILSNDRQHVLS